MMDIDADGPTTTRASVKFRDWTSAGMVITGEKLRQDAEMFRYIAGMLGISENEQRHAAALRSMAAQYEMAANGEEPRAP